MRTHGTLRKWNDDRGFGFIAPAESSKEIFVHISAFPKGERPRVGELISYELEQGTNGQMRAVRVMRPGQRADARPARAHRSEASPVRAIMGLLALAGIGVLAYSMADRGVSPQAILSSPATLMAPAQTFSCDGRKFCSQMTSCAEAHYFLRNCPGTEMDGDGDRVPCEQQWCN